MVKTLKRPRDAAEALALLAADPGAQPLAGGTYLLTSEFRSRELRLVSLDAFLPRAILDRGPEIEIGAGATFQDLLDSRATPEALRQAARGMADRNIRNRATVGGNLGAGKSCASLVPALLALGAELELAGAPSGERAPLEGWLGQAPGAGRGLVLRAFVPAEAGRLAAYRRYARTACDLSLITVAASSRLEGGTLRGLRVAMGGLGPRCRRFPELEALFEGGALPSREEIEAAAAPLFDPISDLRGSAAFKRLRAAALLADCLAALGGAEARAAGGEAGPRTREARR